MRGYCLHFRFGSQSGAWTLILKWTFDFHESVPSFSNWSLDSFLQ